MQISILIILFNIQTLLFMKNKILLIIISLMLIPYYISAENFLNLTPKPMSMKVGAGTLLMPFEFVVSCNNVSDDVIQEANKFVSHINKSTGLNGKVENNTANTLINLSYYEGAANHGEESYTLDITATGVNIKAGTATGFFYAFQTLKKILPPNVCAGVKDEKVTQYKLPLVSITDNPRFGYRGFMLDVSRHFFTTEEVKRMIDIMAIYKMNRFHWHLTDDQGWRFEVPKWPKLVSVGSVRNNSWNVDPVYGRYQTNAPYGPYYYTVEQMKDVVAYAKERHIEVIPEVDMPGHFAAAMTAYPEFSCNPEGSHNVWTDGGISGDILNVANPEAITFAKDILDVLIDIFPYPYIHIGGDECPTGAWESNQQCKDLKNQLGLNSFRALQSYFIKELSDYVKPKGRKLYVWNEAITATGSDTEMLKETDATVMCWTGATGAAQKAQQLGLKNVITDYGYYYINRKQSTDPSEPYGAGNGSDNLEHTYGYNPPTAADTYKDLYLGLQGTFWCEHVSSNYLLEYLALPRLMAVAETSWTPQNNKDFKDFCKRMTADSTMLNYNNYAYGRHYMKTSISDEKIMPKTLNEDNSAWYRIITRNTADANRVGKCIELIREGSPLIGIGNAQVDRLWSGKVALESDLNYAYQLWGWKENPDKKGYYAMICKAKPNGSVNPMATAQNNTGRWDYDNNDTNYNFTIGDVAYLMNGENYCYSIRSDKSATGFYMNMAAAGQNNSINQWDNVFDGDGGVWEFQPISSSIAAKIKKTLKDAKQLASVAKTYLGEEEKHLGLYSAAKKEALSALIKTDISTYTDEQLETFNTQLITALSEMKASLCMPEQGKSYRILNTNENFIDKALCDKGNNILYHSSEPWNANIWIAESAVNHSDTSIVTLKNAATDKFINGNASPLTTGNTGADIKIIFQPTLGDFTLNIGDKAFYPISDKFQNNPGSISIGGIRPQGTGWTIEEAFMITFKCYDANGELIKTFYCAAPKNQSFTCTAPEIANFNLKKYTETGNTTAPVISSVTENKDVEVIYERTAYEITLNCRDNRGAYLQIKKDTIETGNNYTLVLPDIAYYTFVSHDLKGDITFEPSADLTINAIYSTEAITGFKGIQKAVSEIKDGHSYLLYDATTTAGRSGYLNINEEDKVIYTIDNKTEGMPAYVWSAEKSENGFRMKNETGLYIPTLTNGANIKAQPAGDTFIFTLNLDNETWTAKGSNNSFWNGNPGKFTGWSDGHPYKIYEFIAAPYFTVTHTCVDTEGKILSTGIEYVEGGKPSTFTRPEFDKYTLETVEGDEAGLSMLNKHIVLKLTYKSTVVSVDNIQADKDKKDNIYDILGRKSLSKKGLIIQSGKVVIKK